MKRFYLPIIGFAALLIGAGIVLWTTQPDEVSEESGSIALFQHPEIMEAPVRKEKKSIKGWEEFTRMARANQVTGELSPADMIRAREEVADLLRRTKSTRSGLNLDWIFMGPSNKGGRTRDILFDKDNPSRVYTGGVSGGLWYSNNEGESWIPYDKDDTLAGIGVVSLAQTSSGDIYVGTGENWPGSGAGGGTAGGGFLGYGIWKSSDGGNTFVHLPSTRPSVPNSTSANWAYVPSLATHPTDGNTILAGTNKGLKISKDGGQSWANAATQPSLASANIQDIEVTQNGTVHVAASGGYYRGNIDDAASYEERSNQISTLVFSRLALASAPSDENYVYAIACNGDGETLGIYQSQDGGESWNPIAPTTLPSDNFNPTGEQGNYDMEIAVHPLDKEKVYVAGQFSLYTYGEANGQIGWWAISNWATRQLNPSFDPYYVHADHHQIVFHPTKPDWMFVATDGGIFRTKNARADYPELPSFSRQNKNYGVAQFYDISAGIDGKLIGGTQDNGTILIDFQQNEPKHGAFVTGGDAYATEISKTNPNAMFTALYYGAASRSSNSAETFASYFDQNIAEDNPNVPDCGAPQKTVFRLWENMDENDPDYGEGRLFLGTFCGLWAAIDALDFGANPVWFRIVPGSGVNHTAMNASTEGDILYFGTHNGALYRVDGLNSATFEYDDNGTPGNPNDDTFDPTAAGITTTQIGNWPNRYITEIAVDPNDENHVVVTLGNYTYQNYVYRSTTAATTGGIGSFSAIQGNLPRMPVYSAVIDYYNSSNIIVGTEMGLYSSEVAGNVWEPDLNGMPYVAVTTLVQELVDKEGCYSLYAGTYGRGAYQSTTLTPAGCATFTSTEPVFEGGSFGLYPNPASNATKLSFSLDIASEVIVDVYSITGRRALSQNLGSLSTGGHVIPLNTSDLTAGYYLVVLTSADNDRMVQKMVVAR